MIHKKIWPKNIKNLHKKLTHLIIPLNNWKKNQFLMKSPKFLYEICTEILR
jgi:hypothetical protein